MPRTHLPNELRRLVIERAGERCEYCLLHQDDRPETHQVDHVIALKHRGPTISENLALACALCNHAKGSDIASIDPLTGAITPLFNPRAQSWKDHFQLVGTQIVGLTPAGRATAAMMQFNDEQRVLDRQALIGAGLYPPDWMPSGLQQ
jgi:hypothetical protein